MTSNWVIFNKKKNIKEISQRFGLTPLTSVILCNRDIYDKEDIRLQLSSDINDLLNPALLPDIDKASILLKEYIDNKKNIRIVGDYDIDGVCATYILYKSLIDVGAMVSYAIPDRINDGYGINVSIIDKAIEDKIDLIITCDNGIAAEEQIKYAKENGIKVIVTDHHDISELPKSAEVVIDPKRVDSKYSFKGICGAVVAWKFMTYFYDKYKNEFLKDGKYIIDKYFDFAMLATIGDIMPLINENHIIAKLGLTKIVFTENKGLKKLLDISGINYLEKGLTAYHIGFIIGPLINAAGRMESASTALKLFLTEDEKEINELASTLKNLNDERKKITEEGTKLAIEKIEKEYTNDKILVVFVEGLLEQVAGIVAGRIKEKYNKPTIILADTKDTSIAKASCRSIDVYDIFENLNKHNDMLLTFGGHKLAAGFSINKKDIDKLRLLLNEECILQEKDFVRKVQIDAEFPLNEITENLILDIEKLEPYGQSFNRPNFAVKNVLTEITNVYGDNKNIIKLLFDNAGFKIKGILFGDYDSINTRLSDNKIVDILYYPKINDYRGNRSIEINVIEYK